MGKGREGLEETAQTCLVGGPEIKGCRDSLTASEIWEGFFGKALVK